MFALSQRPFAASSVPSGRTASQRRTAKLVTLAADKPEATTIGSNPAAADEPAFTREFTAFGSKVIESNKAFDGPESQPDFWEGEKFDAFGNAVQTFFLPGLVVLGLVVGGFAASSYNNDASVFITPANSEGQLQVGVLNDDGAIIPAPSP